MNVRSAEKLANSFKSLSEPRKARRGVEHHDKCESWAQELSLKFSMGVTVKLNEQGKGTVTFNVNSSAEMDCLLSINKKE